MNEYDVAQSSKFVDFVITHQDGETKIIVENGPTIKCGDLPTDQVIKKLLGETVPGFGSAPITIDHGHTSQYFDEQVVNTPLIQEEKATPLIQRRHVEREQKHQYKL